MNKNNTPEQKAAWQKNKSTHRRNPIPLPRDAVAFWGWNRPVMQSRADAPGAFGRRAHNVFRRTMRKLDIDAVARAEVKSRNGFARFHRCNPMIFSQANQQPMKTKLFAIALMLIGLVCLGWVALIVLLTKGMLMLIYGIIPLIAGWLLFERGSKQSPNQPKETETTTAEIKSGFARIRSFLKGLL